MKGLSKIEDPAKRRAMFMALLSKAVIKRGARAPIVVGGEALEIYTQGGYSTGDIDVIAPRETLGQILKGWGFEKIGRLWVNPKLDIYVDWQGAGLKGVKEPETVTIGRGLKVSVISIEDLIIDRLNAAKWWADADSLMWAKVLVGIKRALGGLDIEYLKKRAEAEEVSDFLKKALAAKRKQGKDSNGNRI